MFHLIALFAVGFSAAGLVLLAYKLQGKKSPRWLVPLAAGLSMIAYAVWSEYSWASRTLAGLPEHVKVVREIPGSAPWRPWTYLVPQTERMVLVDTSQLRRNDKLPGHVLAEVILVQRLEATVTTTQLFDCEGARRADVLPSDEFTEDGLPKDPQWVSVDRGDALYATVCGE